MALTAGFKKFLGLIAVAAVVGGGIYMYKTMPKTTPTEDPVIVTEAADNANTTAPVDLTESTANVRPNASEPTETEPAETAPPKRDASTNRGLDAVLNAGK